jgi:XTP/dITP diphosphohydrolase
MTSELVRLQEVMHRLRSPGGCPWDAEQTHESLLKYLLEESYEFSEAVDEKDRVAMREELGDVLLQVYFHAAIAEEDSHDPFSIDDVARGIADKLIRRHPHVFTDSEVTFDDVLENWEKQKREEKGRTSATDGVPLAQPAMALAAKLIYRADKYGYSLPVAHPVTIEGDTDEAQLGLILLGILDQAQKLGIDAEIALRTATKGYISAIHEYEAEAKPWESTR